MLWHSANARRQCESFARERVGEGLASALTAALDERDGTCRQPIPWLSWSLRLSAEFGAAAEPEYLAIAVELLHCGPDQRAARGQRLRLAIDCLDAASVPHDELGRLMLATQLLPGPEQLMPGADALEPDGTPADHAILWGCVALAAGRDPLPWIAFAARLAEPVGLYLGLLDLLDCVVAPRVATLLRVFARHEPGLGGLLDACAGVLDDPRRIVACLGALANPPCFAHLAGQRRRLLAKARAALPPTGAAVGEAFLAALCEAIMHAETSLWFRLLTVRAQDLAVPPADLQVSVRAAVDYLDDTRPWCSAWDVHRFHPMGAPGVLVNRYFIEGMILLALQHVEGNRQAEIEAYFERLPHADLRYFPDWRGLPPDSDSLGLILRLATHLPSPPAACLNGHVALLHDNLGEDQLLPTWLPRAAQGPKATLPGPFLGNACTATRIVVLWALLQYDAERFAALAWPNLKAILAAHGDAGFSGCVHYDADVAIHDFLCLAAQLAAGTTATLRRVAAELGVGAVAASVSARLAAQQRVDGGWGSPQRTALALEGLLASDADPRQLRRGITYLEETQRPDGSWPAESLYITPSKLGGMTGFGSKELTTALCMRALHLAASRLSAAARASP